MIFSIKVDLNLFFLVLYCSTQFPVTLCKGGRGGGGRGHGRGGFGGFFGRSRGSSNGQVPHQNYHGQTHHNINVPPRVNGGYNPGASSSDMFMSSLAGAAIGAGTAHLLFNNHNHGQPMPTYYDGDKFHKLSNGKVPNGRIVCSVSSSSNDSISLDNNSTMANENSTQKLVYVCNLRNEYCCNNQCCKKEIRKQDGQGKWLGVFLAIMSICLLACCICGIFRYIKNMQKNHWYHQNPWHHQNQGQNGSSNYINAYMEPLPMFQQTQRQHSQAPNDCMMMSGPAAHYNPNYIPAQQMYHPSVPHMTHQEWSQSSASLIEKPPKNAYRHDGY